MPTIRSRRESGQRRGRGEVGQGTDALLDPRAEAVGDLLTLENSISRARAVATLANSLVTALNAAELEERLTALETALKERGDL